MSLTTSTKPIDQKRLWVFLRLVSLTLAGVIIGLWLTITPSGLLGKADAIGYAVCHRIALRSFHLGNRPLPLCARCSGMYLGAILTLIFYVIRKPRAGLYPSRPFMITFALFGLIWVVDGFNSFMHLFPSGLHLYPPSNVLRLITGTLIGIPFATLLYPLFNQSVWQQWEPAPVLGSFRELGSLMVLAGGLVAFVVSENPLLLYPLALISSLSVLILLGSIYTLIIVTLLRRENRASTWLDLSLPMITGLALAILQIFLIGIGRSLFIGGSGW